jgi:disulfide bond formation protein DsbB
MTRLQLRALGAAVGSAALLVAALAFQYLGGLAPCPLCIWQRWPHVAAVVLGLAILAWPRRGLAALAGAAMLAGAGLGLYHVGIERDWWEGPATCTAPVAGDVAPGELLDRILEAPVVVCDAIAWSWLGISMAGWNATLSLALALLWFRAARA